MAKVFMWLCLGAMFLCLGGSSVYLAMRLPVVVDQRIGSIERTLDSRLVDMTNKAQVELSETRGIIDKTAARLTADLNTNTKTLVGVVDTRLADVSIPAGNSLNSAAKSVEYLAGVRDDINPTIKEINSLSGPLMRNALGVVAATKVTMGETAWTMKETRRTVEEIRLATPDMLKTLNQIGTNSDKATSATAGAMANLQEMTRPLPRWLRIFMQVGIPVGPYALAAVAR